RHPEHGGVVPRQRGLVAHHQERRVPRLLRAHVRPAEGAGSGEGVRLLRALGLLAVLLLAGTGASAQSAADLLNATSGGRNVMAPTGTVGSPPMSRPVDPTEYVVGPGDLLQINLSGGVTRSWDAMILPEGTLYVPSIGPIPMIGITLVEARRLVQQRLSVEYRGVNVDLRLLRPRTFLVYMIGETTAPGPHEVSATSRASE